ncbi:unnamed protein product [Gulo gulo]|uniref:Uncharacterized protein n=1 Tax=Gulo gulo TaxID=48420 RepID=A0A9X9LEF5_GULGU|nr:unnamed protein product [Gulo gulo]
MVGEAEGEELSRIPRNCPCHVPKPVLSPS